MYRKDYFFYYHRSTSIILYIAIHNNPQMIPRCRTSTTLRLKTLRRLLKPTRCYINITKPLRERLIQQGESKPAYLKRTLDLAPAHFKSVLASIPDNSMNLKIIYCFNARDFPACFNVNSLKELNDKKGIKLNDVEFMITMIDTITPTNQESSVIFSNDIENYKNYYQKAINSYLRFKTGNESISVNISNIHLSSKEHQELLKNERELIQQNQTYYVIGQTNVGKTQLVKWLTKQIPQHSQSNVISKISPEPCTTRSNQAFENIVDNWTIVDTPGYLPHGLYGYLKDKSIRKKLITLFRKSENFKKVDIGKPPISTDYNDWFLSIGEMIYIKSNVGFKYKKFMYGKPKHVFYGGGEGESLLLNKDLRKYYIPKFHGCIDLVFEGLGYMEIHPDPITGTKTANNDQQFWEIYLPRGMKCIIRNSLSEALSNSSDDVPVVYRDLIELD